MSDGTKPEKTVSLLDEIEGFLEETGMGESYFGKKFARNSELVSRLRDGRRVWPDTEQLVRDGMAAYRAEQAA